MKSLVKIFFLVQIFFFSYNVKAQYSKKESPIWTLGTAKTIGKSQLDLNLLYTIQYGLTTKIELQSKPIWWYKFPNFSIKINWINKKPTPSKNFFKKSAFIISTLHGLYYPTPLMNYIQSKNLYNIDFGVSQINSFFVTKNELFISKVNSKHKGCYKKISILTLKIGNQSALFINDNNYEIQNNSIMYRNTSMLNKDNSLWYIGLDYDSKLNYGLNYSFDVDFYAVGIEINYWILESKGLAYWYMGTKEQFRMTIGYIFSYTNNTDIKFSISPLFDLTYRINTRASKKSNNLFENGVLEKPVDLRE
jgi:hypothetical protein